MLPNHRIKIKSEKFGVLEPFIWWIIKLYSATGMREKLTDSQKWRSKREVEWKSLRMQ